MQHEMQQDTVLRVACRMPSCMHHFSIVTQYFSTLLPSLAIENQPLPATNANDLKLSAAW